ncbi:filamin-A-interacting protein 1 isoform X1 [Pimephales promelas]|uniref:filamin-A-interacting protein 1 isoform X1 n=2 Tax=Pimephales promelas TaxID=90988 RepID=UPI0019556CAA|nr:filamin-A-interacting protein 1 isoform X1 [Pimephales promelas]
MRKMRSKDNTEDDDGTVNEDQHVTQTSHDVQEEDEGKILETEKAIKVKHMDDDEKIEADNDDKSAQNDDQMFGLRDLSKDNLLKLLGIMEGEIQAREDVIHLLRSALLGHPEELESRYGSSGPTRPLQALQRDRTLSYNHAQHENVYDKTMAELDRLRDKHKDSYRRMLEQLLLAEKSHRRTVYELDSEKRKHVDYMNKSDDFTNLLEQERERLKRLLKQEKAYQMRKEKEFSKRMHRISGELVKLKSFALMMVDERELHLEKMNKQSHKIQDLLQKLQEKEKNLNEAERKAKEDKQKIMDLEVELELKTSKFTKEQEEMSVKLSDQESEHQQLSQKQLELLRKLKELEETNEALQKSAEELQALRDKIRKGECGNSNLIAELETLRKRILEMEGKDEEITKTENKCNELKKMLLAEETHNKDLSLEVEKLQQRMTQLEKLEMTFNMGRTECGQLHAALEKEKSLTKELTDELVGVKIRIKELESSELKLEKEELDLKEDLLKLKSVTVIMVNEHKNMADRIRSEEKLKDELNQLYKAEQEKVMEVTERLIEESKKRLKLKSEMELKIAALVKERDEITGKLSKAEEKCKDLHGIMKHGTMNEEERESAQKVKELQSVSNAHGKDENKVKELTLEIDRLKNRLQQLKAIDGDLIKPEYELLATEKERVRFLPQQVHEIRSQTAPSKAIERGEVCCQEAELRLRFMMEEAKSRDLQADVQALKEKIHELMNKEDELSQLQVDYSVLQQRFLEEEDKKKSISTEVLNLTKELEVTKRYSRTLRPITKGSRMMDVPMTSTGIQTDSVENRTADVDTPAAFIKKSVQEENRIMSSLQQRSLKKPAQRPTVRELYPPTVSDFTVKKSWIPWMRKKDSSASEISSDTSGEVASSEVNMSQKHNHPLHSQVIPDTHNNEATLHICIANSEDLTKQASAKSSQEIQTTIIPTNVRTKETKNPERVRSPMTFATISRVKSAEITRSPSLDKSPVSTASQEDMITGRAVFRETPEKRMVPTPIKKSNANVISTEDSKIHIHSGAQFKKTNDHGSGAMVKSMSVSSESTEVSTGTVLRSPHHVTASKSTSSKAISSVTITQVTKAPARPTLSVQPVMDAPSARSGFSRIPMSRGMKTGKAVLGALGISTGVKVEANAEIQPMNIDLKKSTVSNGALQAGGKG